MAPAASAKIATGRPDAVCTSATISADPEREVISHAAPTVWIRLPKLAVTAAIHIAKKILWRNGAKLAFVPVTASLAANHSSDRPSTGVPNIFILCFI